MEENEVRHWWLLQYIIVTIVIKLLNVKCYFHYESCTFMKLQFFWILTVSGQLIKRKQTYPVGKEAEFEGHSFQTL